MSDKVIGNTGSCKKIPMEELAIYFI